MITIKQWDEFIKVYNNSSTLEEVARKLNLSIKTVKTRRNTLSAKGTDLKDLPYDGTKKTGNAGMRESTKMFIAAWTSCDSVPEVCKITGLKYGAATSRAWELRRQGHHLKNLGRKRVDWKYLAKLADKLNTVK
jgi:transposase